MHCDTSCFIPAYYASLWGLTFAALLMYHVSIWNGGMEVPDGPHYPLLIIKGENRGYVALTKRFNWFETLLGQGPLRSRIGRNDHHVLIHWLPSLSPCAPNSLIKTGCVIPCLLESAHKRSLANLQNEWVVILVVGFILSFYRYDHNTP